MGVTRAFYRRSSLVSTPRLVIGERRAEATAAAGVKVPRFRVKSLIR
jgi:hypothetical protein